MRHRKAFTIVELLVVIGIITVLIAILLPALNNAREQARVVVCASNERQIYQAMVLYAANNRDILPIPLSSEYSSWPFAAIKGDGYGQYDYSIGTLWPYVSRDLAVRQKVFLCPSDGPERTTPDAPGLTRNFTYNLNGQLIGNGLGRHYALPFVTGVKLSRIKGADHKLLVLESNDPQDVPNSIGTIYADGTLRFLSLLSHRHFGRANQCFADGHVELFDDSVFALPSGVVDSAQIKHFGVLTPDEGGYLP